MANSHPLAAFVCQLLTCAPPPRESTDTQPHHLQRVTIDKQTDLGEENARWLAGREFHRFLAAESWTSPRRLFRVPIID